MVRRQRMVVEEPPLFDPAPYYTPEPVDEDSLKWIRPQEVHDFGARQLAQFVHDGAMIEPMTGRRGMVVRYTGPGDKVTGLRIRDAHLLKPEPLRALQMTIRRYTASGKTAKEWDDFMCLAFDWFGTAWAEPRKNKLDLKHVVVTDVPRLVEDITERPGVLIRNDKDGTNLFRAGRGERFHAIDLRRVRPEVIFRTHNLEIPYIEPDPVLWSVIEDV